MPITLQNIGRRPFVYNLDRKFAGSHPRIVTTDVVMVRSKTNTHGEEARVQSRFRAPPVLSIAVGETVEDLPDNVRMDRQVKKDLDNPRSGLRYRASIPKTTVPPARAKARRRAEKSEG